MTDEFQADSPDTIARRCLRWVAPLSALYLVVALPAALRFGPPPGTLGASLVLAVLLVTLSANDLVEFRLPDMLTAALMVLGLVLAWLLAWDDLLARAAAVPIGFAGFWLVGTLFRKQRGYDGLGLGDAKLLAACGPWVGLEGLPSLVLLACVLALAAIGIAMLLIGRPAGSGRIPFGPFLGLACWIVWLYGAWAP